MSDRAFVARDLGHGRLDAPNSTASLAAHRGQCFRRQRVPYPLECAEASFRRRDCDGQIERLNHAARRRDDFLTDAVAVDQRDGSLLGQILPSLVRKFVLDSRFILTLLIVNIRSITAVEMNMQKIMRVLWFDSQAEEAANFYVSIFKNSPSTALLTTTNTRTESPAAS